MSLAPKKGKPMSKKKPVMAIAEYQQMIVEQSARLAQQPEFVPEVQAELALAPPLEEPAQPVDSKLVTILRWKRPHDSTGEMAFCKWLREEIAALGAVPQIDALGCIVASVPRPDGKKSAVLFSSHVDTMHGANCGTGKQELMYDMMMGQVFLDHASSTAGACLGADDGAGVWMMLKMIEARKPGTYVFHRGEERGGLGSNAMLTKNREMLSEYEIAVAFDRPGTNEVITHQGGQRCASDKCADALVKELNANGMKYETSTKGIFTDTKVYRGVIPECFNVGVGYEFQHGPQECLNYVHLCDLLKAVMAIDWDCLPVDRDPKAIEAPTFHGSWKGAGYDWMSEEVWERKVSAKKRDKFVPKPVQPMLSPIQELDGMSMDDISWFCSDTPDEAANLMVSLMSDLAAAEARVSVLTRLLGAKK